MILTLDPKKYVKHNLHDEKLNDWLIKNHGAMVLSTSYNGIPKGESSCVCDCYIEDENYVFFYDKYDTWEDLDIIVNQIPNLTEDEREDLFSGIENICVYLCPVCGSWGVDYE